MPIIRSFARTAMLTGMLLLTKGCTALLPDRPPERPEPVHACQRLLVQVDREITADGVTDGAAIRIDGFPYLRSNRFLKALEDQLLTRDQTQAWLEAMHALDLESRRKEISNLSPTRLETLVAAMPGIPDRETLQRRVADCSRTVFAHHRYETDLRDRLRRRTTVPDEYQTWRRLVGLYPLVSLPVALVTDNVYDDFRQWHATPPEDLPYKGRLVTIRPATVSDAEGFDPQMLLRPERLNALGVPVLTAEDERRLALYFAPVVTQDTVGDYDRIGTPIWKDGRVRIDPEKASVYYYTSFALLDGRPRLQINYAFWYPRRDGPNAPWIERGPLDGITVRISLDHQARPFMVDLMNNCGCYHFFIPARDAVKAIREIAFEVDPLVPGWIPKGFPDKRLRLRVNTGWHQVQHVGTARDTATGSVYDLVPYESLEMLPDAAGRTRSIFDDDGIAFDSERIEPLIFFSMGIPDVGSMRQRGRHAIKLVGRAYFDDPLLFEQSFEFDGDYFGRSE
ncbi:MAG: hypothetical protein QNJ01_11270 [Desulfobacterales bacterium]|nr:hypothetical protein [Desulfobacterales bacterium]